MTTTQTAPSATTAIGGAGPRRSLVLAVIAVAQLMIVLDASVVIVALPSAQRALHISIADRQWVMSAYTLAFGSLLLLGGRIADYLGRRRMFVIGLLGFATASALGGLAQDPAMLFGARALQGAFAAVMAPAALSILTVTFTEPRRACARLRRLRGHRRRGRGHRARARRDTHAAGVVALDPAHQRADRPRGGGGGDPTDRREPRAVRDRVRPPRRHVGHGRALPARLRVHHRRHRRMERPAHRGVADRRAGDARRLRGHRDPLHRTRCSRCGWCSTATAAGRSWRRCSWAAPCWARSCS